MSFPIGQKLVEPGTSGTQTACRMHISEATEAIFRIWSYMELFKSVVLQRYNDWPICTISFPWGKHLSNLVHVPCGYRLCRTHTCQTVGTILLNLSYMELSRPVVVQYDGHLFIATYGLAHGTECISLKPLDVRSSMELPGPVVVQSQGHLHIRLIWACPWAK